MTLLDFVPILIFPLELKKEINRPLRLLNRTDEHVAFKVKTGNSKKFNVKPISGVVAPRSTCSVVVTLLARKELPADMQCKDEFVIQSTITKAGITKKDSGHVVEEQKFRAAYVLPIKPASSIPEDIFYVRETSSSKDFKSMVKTSEELVLNLVVNIDKGRVIYAETDKCFVDIILSFLTLPIGAISRLFDMNSGLGCMDNLCKSVDELCSDYLKSSGRSSLLRPERTLHSCFWNLVNWNKSQATKYCLCKKIMEGQDSSAEPQNATCLCGIRSYCDCVKCDVVDVEEDKNGLLFVKPDTKFIVRDDLLISPISRDRSIFSVFQEVGILFGENVREMTVIIKDGDDMMKKLLQRSLVSLTPLSDVLLQQREEKTKMGNEIRSTYSAKREDNDAQLPEIKISTYSAKREDNDAQLPEIKIKILKSIMQEKVLYAEAGADFVNLLFNLLTYHVGSFSSLPQGHPITCFRSLCQSMKNLETAEYFKCERCKSRLLSPELPHKLCQSVFKGNVQDPEGTKDKKVRDYWYGFVKEGYTFMVTDDLKDKKVCDYWYGFVKEGYTFMVTDDLNVTPMSGISVLSALREINSTAQEVQECEVKVGRKEAEDLVMASMTSKMALTRTFLLR